MDIKVTVDIPKSLFGNMDAQIELATARCINSTLIAVKNKWESIAQQKLHTTRGDYILGLNSDNSLEFPSSNVGILTLRGKWANMLEQGFSSFNMKDGFKNSEHVKLGKNGGWYLTIPLRHRTPGTLGSAVMGSAMPRNIYNLAKKGRKINDDIENNPSGVTSWKGYVRKNGIYTGMQKNTKTYDKSKQNTYFTFRRVSEHSDPNSWWHPGFEGVHAEKELKGYAEQTFKDMFNAMF